MAFNPRWGPLSCLTWLNSGNSASSGIVNSSTVLNNNPLHLGVSNFCTKRISWLSTPSKIFSPGLTNVPSSLNRLKISSSSHSWKVPFLTVISLKISFFSVTVTIPDVWLKISFTTSVPASIHFISSIINREISLFISCVSWGIQSNVPPWLTSKPFLDDLAFLTLNPGAYFTNPPVFVRNLSSAKSAITSPLLILLPGVVFNL